MTHASVSIKNWHLKRFLVAQEQHPVFVPGCETLKTLCSGACEPVWY
jgi:hypothetical protein